MDINVQRETFVRHSRHLAVLLEVLAILALLSGAIPLSLGNPVWYLRLADAAVGLAPALLLAVILLQLGRVLVISNPDLGLLSGLHGVRLAKRWAFLFAFLVPLQLVGFGWLLVDSGRQLEARSRQLETERAALLSPLLASGSEAELRQQLSQAPQGTFPAPPLSILQASRSLPAQKQQLNQATLGALNKLQANLRNQRESMLANSLPGALRGLIGATLISTFLFTIIRPT